MGKIGWGLLCAVAGSVPAMAAPYEYGQRNSAAGDRAYAQPAPRNSGSTMRPGRYENQQRKTFGTHDDYELNVGLKGGYRVSDLKWNIASDPSGTATPNVLSELEWEAVEAKQITPHIEYVQNTGPLKGLYLEGSVDKAISFKGRYRDSDYLGDDRTLEFSRSSGSSDAGHAEAFSAGIGYAFNFRDARESTLGRFIALVGYAKQKQRFVQRDGYQNIETFGVTPPLGPFANLRSSYEIEIDTPFVGGELTSFISSSQRLKIRGQYFYGNYEGIANWNLRTDFAHPVSFKHEADGHGYLIGMEYGWLVYPKLELTLSGRYQYFIVEDGTDTTYLAGGGTASTRLNEAEWSSQTYMTGLSYLF